VTGHYTLRCICCGADLFSPAGHQPCPQTMSGYHLNQLEAHFMTPTEIRARRLAPNPPKRDPVQ
jgi:hypothetical protein